jgi:NAD(P)-dependent dehydrogenase (short-subunit alcohol dehydrogenase family)
MPARGVEQASGLRYSATGTEEIQMRTWLITGASSGFGRAIANEALRRGERVVATARRPPDIDDFRLRHPETALPLRLDVTDPANVAEAVAQAAAWAGTLDVLVNNAGYGVHGAIEEVADDEARAVLDVNLFGLLRVTRAVLPVMRRQGSGHIVNIGSMGGLVAGAGSGVYAATKFALEGLSEALRDEVAPLGIAVTVVEPGPFRTDFNGRSIQVAATSLPAYAETAGRRSAALRANSGKQPGDPDKAARIICDLVAAPEPPFHLLLGNAAVDRVRPKLEALLAEIARSEALSRSADG